MKIKEKCKLPAKSAASLIKRLVLCFAVLLTGGSFVLFGQDTVASADSRYGFAMMPSTVQVRLIQNDFTTEYGENMKVSLAKNEKEAVQMIVSPKVDVKHYQVIVDDLKTESGEVLKSENVSVQVAKYIQVLAPTLSLFTPGYYPDALVPYDKVRAAGEDRIKRNCNQSFWFEVSASKEQAAGTYTGDVYFVMNNEVMKKTLTVEIYDFTMPDEVSAKSLFLTWEDTLLFAHEEVTDELLSEYYEFLIDYKTASKIPMLRTYDDPVKQAEIVAEYASRPEVPSVDIPYILNDGTDSRIPGYTMKILDEDHMETLLIELVKRSTNEKNLFDKLILSTTEFDEPSGIRMQNLCFVTQDFMRLKDKIASDGALFAGKEKVRESMLNLEFLQAIATSNINWQSTYFMDRDKSSSTYGYGIDTWCVLFNAFEDTDGKIAERRAAGDRFWGYGCIQPKYPYPTYHLDDNLISGRTIGWYMKDFGMEGNLYWGTALYGKYTGDYYKRDIWGDPLLISGANGDGYLVYSGEKYGLSVLPTQRLLQVRDANDDYEYLTLLEKANNGIAEKAGLDDYDFDAAMKYVYGFVYDNSQGPGLNKYYADGKGMSRARDSVASQIILANDGIMLVKDGGNLKVYSANGAVVKKIGGSDVTGSSSGNAAFYSAAATGETVEISYETASGASKTVSVYISGGNAR